MANEALVVLAGLDEPRDALRATGRRAPRGKAPGVLVLGAGAGALGLLLVGGCGGGGARSSGAGTAVGAAPLVLDESFEGGTLPAGWKTALIVGPFGVPIWEVGAPANTGPAAAFAGSGAAATIIADRYPNATYSTLETPPLDLRGVVQPTLQFHHAFDTEATFDGGNLKISADGGLTFDTVLPSSVSPPYTGILVGGSQLTAQHAWSGLNPGTSEGGYDFVRVDLDVNLPAPVPRDRVVIRFDFASDNTSRSAGWYLDLVQVDAAARLPTPPRFLSAPVVRATEGVAYSYIPAVDGSPAPELAQSGLPPGLALAGGAITGTPGFFDIGSYPVVLTATNAGGVARQRFTLEVVAREAGFASASVEVAIDGAAYAYALDVTGVEPLAVSAVGLPSSLALDAGTRTIAGTASTSDVGVYEVELTASNGFGSAVQRFALHVVEANPAPFFFEGFEGAAAPPADWSATGDWEVGVPTTGPEAAFEGVHVAATNLDGIHATRTFSSLTSRSLDLGSLTRPGLLFRGFLDSEAEFDGGNLKLSDDDGATFAEVDPATVDPSYGAAPFPAINLFLPNQLGYSGQTGGYAVVTLDLDANLPGARDLVRIQWDFGSDGGVDLLGWYVDAVVVDEVDRLPRAPRITSAVPTTGKVGQLYGYAIATEGFPEPSLSATGLPTTLTLDPATRTISGTPLPPDAGSYAIVVTAANANGLARQRFTLDIAP